MMSSSSCADSLDYGEVYVMGTTYVGAVVITLGCLYFFISVIILYIIQYQKRQAMLDEEEKAGRATIFPIFVYVLWANAIVNVYVGCITILFDLRSFGDHKINNQLFAFSVMYGVQHVVTEGVAFMLMQKGVGWNAAKRSLKYAVLWGIVTFVCYSIEYSGTNIHAQTFFGCLWNVALLLFYGALWLTPQKHLYRRPAAMMYAKFWCFFRLVNIVALALAAFPVTADAAQCVSVYGNLFPFAILEPIILYYTLLQDSRWWQGMDISQGRRQDSVEEIRSPLQGVDLALESAQSLAAQLDSMGKKHRSYVTTDPSAPAAVRLLNFAYISLDNKKMLGSGSFSKVYMGKYRQRQCAIKLVFTLDLTSDIIRRVAAEAQLLSSIRHPNIVEILGVSVLPPSVCLLLELCHYGSLADIIHGTGALDLFFDPHVNSLSRTNSNGDVEANLPPPPAAFQAPFLEDFLRGGPSIGLACKRHLNLSWTDRLHLIVGCARGLNALHAFSPNLVHRDVKSFNFLVDSHLNAKISDLELGTAEDLGPQRRQYLTRSTATTPTKKAISSRSTTIKTGATGENGTNLSNESSGSNLSNLGRFSLGSNKNTRG